MTTTMNESTSASTPMPSTADWLGTMMAPPRPAMKQPSVKASTYTRLTFTPRADAMRMFCEVARSTTPNFVR
jgi:hypothetical protein